MHPLDEGGRFQESAAAQAIEHQEAVLPRSAERIRERVSIDTLVTPIGNRRKDPSATKMEEGQQSLVALERGLSAERGLADSYGRGMLSGTLIGCGNTITEHIDRFAERSIQQDGGEPDTGVPPQGFQPRRGLAFVAWCDQHGVGRISRRDELLDVRKVSAFGEPAERRRATLSERSAIGDQRRD